MVVNLLLFCTEVYIYYYCHFYPDLYVNVNNDTGYFYTTFHSQVL